MDLTVEMWPVERLVPYARNPRKNDEQVEKMAASIREFGFRIPVVAKSDGSVIDGHLRLKAALVLGLSEVPVALADDLTDAQVKAFRIMANKSAEWAAWDDGLLRLELEDRNLEGRRRAGAARRSRVVPRVRRGHQDHPPVPEVRL